MHENSLKGSDLLSLLGRYHGLGTLRIYPNAVAISSLSRCKINLFEQSLPLYSCGSPT